MDWLQPVEGFATKEIEDGIRLAVARHTIEQDRALFDGSDSTNEEDEADEDLAA